MSYSHPIFFVLLSSISTSAVCLILRLLTPCKNKQQSPSQTKEISIRYALNCMCAHYYNFRDKNCVESSEHWLTWFFMTTGPGTAYKGLEEIQHVSKHWKFYLEKIFALLPFKCIFKGFGTSKIEYINIGVISLKLGWNNIFQKR